VSGWRWMSRRQCMRDASVVVARPETATRLALLFHGVGSSAANLVPLGRAIAQAHPGAVVVSVDASHASTLGSGREWFSVVGITEQNRPDRIAKGMPLFLETVAEWQQSSGVGPEGTALVGFSQGAIMSLEATQVAGVAHRVVAISGRFAQPPRHASANVTFRFVHGENDPVIDARFSVQAAELLQLLGADAVAQMVPGLGHGIDGRVAQLVLESL
jgi:phospholipase/carboxylesterase